MQIEFFQHKHNKQLEQFVSLQKGKAIAYLQGKFSISLADCEDIFQESFITLYKNNQSGKLEKLSSSLSTYFIGICRNKALEFLRGKGKYITSTFEINNTDKNTFLDDQVEKILMLESESESIQKKKEALVRDIVRSLPSPCDELLWGYYRDGFSMKILADKFNYASENAVKVTKHRCCEKFRNRFNECVKSLF